MTSLSVGQVGTSSLPLIVSQKQTSEDDPLEITLKEIDKLKHESITSEEVRILISSMQGGTFFINDILYSGLGVYFKSHINPADINNEKYKGLKDYIDLSVFEVDRDLWPPKIYPKDKLGNNIAIRWFDNFGHTSLVTPFQMAEIIKTILKRNPIIAANFVSDLMLQAFYGTEKTKSY